jgi:tRNA-dihydrouridine synthase
MKNESDEITLADLLGPDERKPARTKQVGELSARAKHARNLFLYGNGDGKPIRNLRRVAEYSGCGLRTIEKHAPAWQIEADELAKSSAGTGGKTIVRVSVTAEMIEIHEKRVKLLHLECDRLEKILPKLPAGSDMHRDALKLFTATLKAWSEASGIAEHFETASAFQKEMAKQLAKKQGGEKEPPMRQASGFAFDTGLKRIG